MVAGYEVHAAHRVCVPVCVCVCVRARARGLRRGRGGLTNVCLAQLPAASAPPAANYVPWVQTGNLVFISGQVAVPARPASYVYAHVSEYDLPVCLP
jgi:hypothetical protein